MSSTPFDNAALESYLLLAQFMKDNHITRIKLPEIELDMYPTGFSVPKTGQIGPVKDTSQCKCGHSSTYHGDDGACIEGCIPELCSQKD